MERKYNLKLYFTYKRSLELDEVIDCKIIEFNNVKDANDFKKNLKFIIEHQEKPLINNPLSLGYKQLAERLLDPNNELNEIRIIDKFEIFVQTNELIN